MRPVVTSRCFLGVPSSLLVQVVLCGAACQGHVGVYEGPCVCVCVCVVCVCARATASVVSVFSATSVPAPVSCPCPVAIFLLMAVHSGVCWGSQWGGVGQVVVVPRGGLGGLLCDSALWTLQPPYGPQGPLPLLHPPCSDTAPGGARRPAPQPPPSLLSPPSLLQQGQETRKQQIECPGIEARAVPSSLRASPPALEGA